MKLRNSGSLRLGLGTAAAPLGRRKLDAARARKDAGYSEVRREPVPTIQYTIPRAIQRRVSNAAAGLLACVGVLPDNM